jgi:hypothetical protein
VSVIVEEDFKRWTAKRKAALVTEILKVKITKHRGAFSRDEVSNGEKAIYGGVQGRGGATGDAAGGIQGASRPPISANSRSQGST